MTTLHTTLNINPQLFSYIGCQHCYLTNIFGGKRRNTITLVAADSLWSIQLQLHHVGLVVFDAIRFLRGWGCWPLTQLWIWFQSYCPRLITNQGWRSESSLIFNPWLVGGRWIHIFPMCIRAKVKEIYWLEFELGRLIPFLVTIIICYVLVLIKYRFQ